MPKRTHYLTSEAYNLGYMDGQKDAIDNLCKYMEKFNDGSPCKVDIDSWRQFLTQAMED